MKHIKKDGSFLCNKNKGKFKLLYKDDDFIKQSDFIKHGHLLKSQNICPDCLKIQSERFKRNLVVV